MILIKSIENQFVEFNIVLDYFPDCYFTNEELIVLAFALTAKLTKVLNTGK